MYMPVGGPSDDFCSKSRHVHFTPPFSGLILRQDRVNVLPHVVQDLLAHCGEALGAKAMKKAWRAGVGN
jgi:hypothetical protein